MRPQRDEPRVLQPLPAQQHPQHRGLEVVVPDLPGRHPTERLERPDMPIQERLGRDVAIRDVHRPRRTRQPHHKHVQLQPLSRDHRDEITEIDLRIPARDMRLRHHHLTPIQTDLDLQLVHQRPNRGLRNPSPLLIDQPLPHPPRRVPLLPRRSPIGLQPPADRVHPPPRHRTHPIRHLPRRRHRIAQRRTHRPAMHPMPRRQLPDRQLLIPTITSDTFELLHPRSLLQAPTPPGRLGRRPETRGW